MKKFKVSKVTWAARRMRTCGEYAGHEEVQGVEGNLGCKENEDLWRICRA
jgi:hypothetical protein